MTKEYIIYGILSSLITLIIQRKQWQITIRLPIISALLLLTGLIVYVNIISSPIYLGVVPWYNSTPWIEVFFFFFMMIGMAASYFTKAIEVRRERIIELKKKHPDMKDLKKVAIEWDVWEFSYPFFFSFITFGTLLTLIDVYELTHTNMILCFQTGFFWQTLLKKKVNS